MKALCSLLAPLRLFSFLVAGQYLLLLYVSVAGLAVVEGQACYSSLPYLFHRQLLIRGLLKPSHLPPVRVGGPRHLAQTHITWKDPDQTECGMCFTSRDVTLLW